MRVSIIFNTLIRLTGYYNTDTFGLPSVVKVAYFGVMVGKSECNFPVLCLNCYILTL